MSIQEIVKYATSTPHNTNPNVLKTMLEQEMTGENFNKALAPIVEAIKSVGGTVESETVDGVAEAVENLDAMINPIEELPAEGTDLLGEYHSSESFGVDCVHQTAKYLRVKRKKWGNSGLTPYFTYGCGADLTDLEEAKYLHTYKGTVASDYIINTTASRLIMPEKFPYIVNRYGAKEMPLVAPYPPCCTYLSKNADFAIASTWISTNTTTAIQEQFVKCPKDTEIPYYLNKFTKITVDSMVGIFENLIDNSNGSTTLTLTLGTDNLAKLTEEQKNIAYAKGWNLA